MNDTSNLKLIYSEILQGYSCFRLNNSTYYIKHLNNLDVAQIDIYHNNAVEYAVSRGIDTEQTRLNKIIESKEWSLDKEREITELQDFLSNLKHTKKQYVLEKDKKMISKEIESHSAKLTDLLLTKNKLIGRTAEQYANKKMNEYYIYISIHKDSELKNRMFSEEEFNELETLELYVLSDKYNKKMEFFTESIFKKIALMPFFMNVFLLSDKNPFNFFGKPVLHLTFYQIEIFQHAKNFNHILSTSKIQPPIEILNNPDKLFEWFENSKHVEQLIDQTPINENNDEIIGGTSVVGAKDKDYEQFGINSDQNKGLMEKLKNKGELNIFDIINS